MREPRNLVRGCGTLLLCAAAGAALPQTFPTQRVTFIVPFPPGGPTDLVARHVATQLEQKWKQPVIVDNRPGGGTILGVNAVARAAPDGHTLLLIGNAIVTLRIFNRDVEFADTELKAVAQLVRGLYAVGINADVPAKTLSEFIAYAKARPKQLNYATTGLATSVVLDYAHFLQKTGLELTLVNYNGSAPSASGLARGEAQLAFSVPSSIAPHVTAGRVVVLAVTTAQRSSLYPNVPTVRELGIDFDAEYNFGLMAPAATPDALVNQIGSDAVAAIRTPSVLEKLPAMGLEATGLVGQGWTRDLDRMKKIYVEMANRAGIRPQ